MSMNVLLTGGSSPTAAPVNDRPRGSKEFSAQANEFEAMLLTQWLQSSESTFGSAPGEDDSTSAGDDQIRSFALQQLASGIAAKGGVGIARYVSAALAGSPPKYASPQTDRIPAQARPGR